MVDQVRHAFFVVAVAGIRLVKSPDRDAGNIPTEQIQGRAAMIDVHYWPTPNGKKVTILLEELGMAYKIIPCNIGKGDQFTKSFLDIGPNNRMPAIVDHEPVGGGKPIDVFESGAIMMYLADKAGRFYPKDVRGRAEVNQWGIWQMANQ